MEILSALFEISVYSVVLLIIILAVKKIFKYKMSPVLHFAVWFILIARLCVPVTIDSGLRFITLPAKPLVQSTPMVSLTPEKDNDGYVSTGVQSNSIQAADYPMKTNEAQVVTSDNAIQKPVQFDWTILLIALWILGILIQTSRITMSAVKMNRIIYRQGRISSKRVNSILIKCNAEMNIKRSIPLFLLPSAVSPALTIGLRPKLILPEYMAKALSDEQIGYALTHELMHYKRKDHVISILMRILEVVYWFNPVVWIMNKLIVADMETACDSMVVKTLDKTGRKHYVMMLLDMFSSKVSPQFLLGMALNNSEVIAEKRIKGVYMKNKSKLSVKAIAVVLAVVMFVCCFTTACQPIAAAEVKKDAIAAANTGETSNQSFPASLQEGKYTAPLVWKDKYTSGSNTVIVDASVVCPDFDSIDVLDMKFKDFTQEQADSLIKYFVGDAKLYVGSNLDTKEGLESMIAETKKGLKMTQKERDELLADGTTTEGLQKWLGELNERYDALLKGIKPKETTSEFVPDKDGSVIEVHTDNGGDNDVVFEVFDLLKLGRGATFGVRLRDASKGGKILSYSGEPEEIAQKIFNDLGIKDMNLVRTAKVNASNEPGNTKKVTRLFYEPSIYGLPVRTFCGLLSAGKSEEDAMASVLLNDISFDVSENGLTDFSWFDYAEVTGKVQENVALLSFEDIKKQFVKNIFQQPIFSTKNWYGSQAPTATVSSIELCMVLVPKDASTGEYLLVPAWNFYSSDRCQMTLNAVDGSLIHR